MAAVPVKLTPADASEPLLSEHMLARGETHLDRPGDWRLIHFVSWSLC